MSDRYQAHLSLFLGLGSMFLLVSCTESKISQCNKLLTEINQGQSTYEKSATEMQTLGNFSPKNPEDLKAQVFKVKDSLGKFVQEIRKVSQQIKELNLGDDKLKQLQGNYASQLDAIASGLDDSGQAFAAVGTINFASADALKQVENSTKRVGESIQKVSQAGQESNRIVGEINSYCSNN